MANSKNTAHVNEDVKAPVAALIAKARKEAPSLSRAERAQIEIEKERGYI